MPMPIPAIVFIAVGLYLLLMGLVLGTRRCLLARGCCQDCGESCGKTGVRGPCGCHCCCCRRDCAQACDFTVPSPARCLDACCPRPAECSWVPGCPHCCPLCDCACACQPPDCQSLNCLCFEIKLR
ncbi:uncharaterized LOC112694756 homolog [Tachyglossus aculeatus]|uniref:uncharaterized LOC112694756 homolog n=1 Tax=Tachyglossus aculeatus TaxID=9261 RepID=UPI0018F63747|nr:uncharaterized LOC112694756 homolog [Tachyglossus aculeatus]